VIEWRPVAGSTWIVAEAYDAETETIYLRLDDGAEWAYSACPPDIWQEFTEPGQSRGKYFHRVLKFKPATRHTG
jgi:hypothetical protein